jgi:hypothetical protein
MTGPGISPPGWHSPSGHGCPRAAPCGRAAASRRDATHNYPSLFLYLHATFSLDRPLLGWIPGLAEQAPVTAVMGISYAPTPGYVPLCLSPSPVNATVPVVVPR